MRTRLTITVISLLTCLPYLHCAGFDTAQHWTERNGVPPAEYFRKFPYRHYLKDVAFTDFGRLQQDRLFFWKECGDGDEFLYRLGDAFTHQYQLSTSGDPQKLYQAYEERIKIGEAFRNPHKGFNAPTDAIYQVIGNYLLGEVALALEKASRRGTIQLNSSESSGLIQRLASNRVYLQIEDTEQSKFLKNLRAGNFEYLVRRMSVKLSEHRRLSGVVLFGSAVALAALVYLLTRKIRRGMVVLILACVGATGVWSVIPATQPATTGPSSANVPVATPLKLRLHQRYHPVGGMQQFGLEIFLLRRGSEIVGSSFWFDRRVYRAAYLANDVPREYPLFLQTNHVAMVAAGGFTNSYGQPEGLTLQAGNVVNSVLMPDRHALVLIEPEGGIRVLSLRQERLELPLGANKTKAIENPLNNLLAYAELLEWCRTRKVTMFQTQLLAFSDKVLIDPGKAKPELRERRILALVSQDLAPTKTSTVHHIIFNIVAPCNLADVSAELFATLKVRKMKIEALLNLDVGAYNILQSFDERGALLSYTCPIVGHMHDLLREQRDPSTGTNLLVYVQ